MVLLLVLSISQFYFVFLLLVSRPDPHASLDPPVRNRIFVGQVWDPTHWSGMHPEVPQDVRPSLTAWRWHAVTALYFNGF